MPHMTVEGQRIYKSIRSTGVELRARHPGSKVTRSFHRRTEEGALEELQRWLRGPGEPSKTKAMKEAKAAERIAARVEQKERIERSLEAPRIKDQYPAIKALSHRVLAAQQASSLLQSVGLDEQALLVEEAIALSPVEQEAIKLWNSLG